MTNDPQNRPDVPDETAYRDYLAQSWWPPPPTAAAPDPAAAPVPQHPTPPSPPTPQPLVYPSAQHPAPVRNAGGWRSVGVAALGLVGGFLAAIVLQDIIGVAFIRGAEGTLSLGVALLIAALMPVLSAAGVVVALVIDRAARRRERATDARR